jgi:hypothetical protein
LRSWEGGEGEGRASRSAEEESSCRHGVLSRSRYRGGISCGASIEEWESVVGEGEAVDVKGEGRKTNERREAIYLERGVGSAGRLVWWWEWCVVTLRLQAADKKQLGT